MLAVVGPERLKQLGFQIQHVYQRNVGVVHYQGTCRWKNHSEESHVGRIMSHDVEWRLNPAFRYHGA